MINFEEELKKYKKEIMQIEEKNKILHEKLLPELYQFTKKIYDTDRNKQLVI